MSHPLQYLFLIAFLCLSFVSKSQCPSVALQSDKSDYCLLDQVQMLAKGIPSGSTIEWKTDTAWVKGTDKFSFSINKVGKTNVQLKIVLANSTVCYFNDANLFIAKDLPKPTFTVSRSLICFGLDTILLVDNTKGTIKRSWIVNGFTFNNTSDSFILSLPSLGNQNITLVVEDSFACRGVTEIKNALVVYDNPKLDFTIDNNRNCLPLNTNYKSTYNLSGQSIKQLIWQLPGSNKNGAPTADVNGVYYGKAGVYYAQIEIETNQGCAYKKRIDGFIQLGDTATVGVSVYKNKLCLSEPVVFAQTNASLTGSLTWKINSFFQRPISQHQIEMTFRDTGYFDLELIYYHNGCITKYNSKNIVKVTGLKANFKSDNAFHCEAPHKVLVTNLSDTVSAKITGFIWNVRESNSKTLVYTSTSKHLNYTINQNNIAYDVELIVQAEGGCNDTFSQKEFIYIKKYNFNFLAAPKLGCPGQTIVYTNQTKTGSYYGFDQFSWEFLAPNKSTFLGKSADISPTFTYKDTGVYHTKLVAANPLGCNQDSLAIGIVSIIKPIIKIGIPNKSVCQGDSVLFLGITEPLTANYQHKWEFTHKISNKKVVGNGNNFKMAFTDLGEYSVKSWLDIVGNCNDTVYSSIAVNGIDGEIKMDSVSGCSPFIIKPAFDVKLNEHFGQTNDDLKYNWSVEPSAGVIINGTRAAKPEITLTQNGNYTLILFVTNTSGCGFYARSNIVKVGVKAGLQTSSNLACVGQTIQLKDISDNNPNIRNWTFFPLSGATLTKIDSVNRTLSFQKLGSYDVLLVVAKSGSCFDSIRQAINVTSLKVNFYATDTFLSCAPSKTKFVNLSMNADSLIWYFGEGNTSRSLAFDTLYEYTKNSGFGNAFDVTLIAKSNFGCADTLVRKKYIAVNGPVPDFDMTNFKGCNPLLVTFIDKSKNVKWRYIDYGDGSKLDTFGVKTHLYTNNTSQAVQSFQPIMYGRDSSGCLSSFTLLDKVEVYKVPEIRLSFYPDTVVCQREYITVKDTGKYSSQFSWYVNGKLLSNAQSDSIIIEDPGLNQLMVISSSNYGCADTVFQTINAKVSDKLIFNHSKIICVDKPINFSITVDGKDKPTQYFWSFGEIGNPKNIQITIPPAAVITYNTPGEKIITVEGKLLNGCRVPNKDTITVFDSKNIPQIEINAVSIDSLNRPNIKYLDFNFNYFRSINLYRNDSLVLQDTITPERVLLDTINVLNFTKVCYNLGIKDQCETEGKKGRLHCPIVLKVTSPSDKAVLLDWSYYIGWNRVDYYKIYRSYNGAAFQFVEEVFGTIKSYLDTNLCNVPYTYYVAASQNGIADSAASNRATVIPQFAFNTALPDIKNVTVTDNEEVFITWDTSTFSLKGTYDVLKYQDNLANLLSTTNVANNWYTDANVRTSDHIYLYKVREVDVCGNKTATGGFGKTILLKGQNVDKISNIWWTDYQEWPGPTSHHNIYFIDIAKNKLLIDSVSANQYSFQDFGFYESIDGFYQYKVGTISQAGDTSFSNKAKVPGKPVYFIPTAFSPNGDGINDKFSFYNLFVTSANTEDYKDFEIEIYNRWGQMVYYSNNIKESWDGNYLGKPAPTGLYLLKIRLTGSDESRNFEKDVIYLAR